MSSSDMRVGREREGKRGKVDLSVQKLSTHCHVMGSSGMGKSWLLRLMLTHQIELNNQGRGGGLCLIDPAGDLYDYALRLVSTCRVARERLKLIDLTEKKFFPGLNYMDQPGNKNPDAIASMVVNGLNKAFGQEEERRVLMERYFKMIMVPFYLEGFTFNEIVKFLNSKSFRLSVLVKLVGEGKIGEDLASMWVRYDSDRREREMGAGAVLSRITQLINFATESDNAMIFGQERTTVDFYEAMQKKQIVLCNLSPGSQFDEQFLDLVGTVLVDKILTAALSRKPNVEVPFHVYVDEFSRFCSNRDINRSLNECRKFHVPFILSHQNLGQLEARDKQLFKSVMGNCNVRILFRADAEDAEVFAKNMFSKYLASDKIQDELVTQMLTPMESTRTVTSHTDTHSYSVGGSSGKGGGSVSGSGDSSFSTSGTSLTYGEDGIGGFFGLFNNSPLTTAESDSGGSAWSSYNADSSSWSEVDTSSVSDGQSISKSVVPWYEIIVGKQVTGRSHYSYQDKVAHIVDQIVSLDERCAFIQVGRCSPIGFFSQDVPEPDDTKIGMMRARECAYIKNKSGFTRVEIEKAQELRIGKINAIIKEHGHKELTAGGALEADFTVVGSVPDMLDKARGSKEKPKSKTKRINVPARKKEGAKNKKREL